jgi:hypothetical protein
MGHGVAAAFALAAGLGLATGAMSADFATPGGPPPTNIGEVSAVLREDPYDLELLISYGTSKGGSAGHLALAIRGEGADDVVYSANYYADRAPKHAKGYYNADLMVRIPKTEYLFATVSTLAPTAMFGLDFGEVYKRSVVGVRVSGVPASEKQALAAFFQRINDDFHKRAKRTEYHDREVVYDYVRLNCAKTIGSAFRYGAGYQDLVISNTRVLPGHTFVVAGLKANIPTEMAMKLIAEWSKRGYGLDVVYYRKYEGSPYVDPHVRDKVAFKDLPNRFPSVLSRDFRREQGEYRDYDNLYAMHLLRNLGRYSVQVNGETRTLEIAERNIPMPYAEAVEVAKERAAARQKP